MIALLIIGVYVFLGLVSGVGLALYDDYDAAKKGVKPDPQKFFAVAWGLTWPIFWLCLLVFLIIVKPYKKCSALAQELGKRKAASK